MAEEKSNRKKTLPVIFTAYILICAAWGVYRFFLDKPMSAWIGSEIIGALLEGVIKSILLPLPSLLLMKALEDDLQYPIRQTFSFKFRTLLSGFGLSALFFAFYSLRNLLLDGGVRYAFTLSADVLISAVFFAAITEEIMYRGFILNALAKRFGKEWGNIITALLFALMHLPVWIAGGKVAIYDLLTSLLSTACVGYLLGWIFLRDGVVWGAVIAHAMHNFIVHIIKPAG